MSVFLELRGREEHIPYNRAGETYPGLLVTWQNVAVETGFLSYHLSVFGLE